MDEITNFPGNYRIEISGWGLDSRFFVEKTELFWEQNGGKKVSLHHAIAEGAMVFVRLVLPNAGNSIPVAYRAAGVGAMDCYGRCEIQLTQLHPRTQAPNQEKSASYSVEDAKNEREPKECFAQMEPEEILQ